MHAEVEGEHAVGRAVDEVVDVRLDRPNASFLKSAAQPSGIGTPTSAPSVS